MALYDGGVIMKRSLPAALVAGILAIALVPILASAATPPWKARCTDPSGICPPSSSAGPHYVWSQCKCTGGSSEEFTGSKLPRDFVAADSNSTCATPPYAAHDYSACYGVPSYGGSSRPPDSYTAWFSPGQVSVSGGELHLGTSWRTGNRDCNAYWGEAVFGTGRPAPGCWISGSVGQKNARWAWQKGATEAFAFEAKWAGTAKLANLDSTIQVASYPRWPPEVDVAETDYTGTGTGPGSSFNSFVHCPASGKAQNVDGNDFSGDGTPNGAPISTGMTSWHTYEFDISPSAITVYVDRHLRWTLNENDSWCTSTILGGAGDMGSSSDWPPTAGAMLGAFMEAEMLGTGDPKTSDKQTILIDWVAER